ncbi:MAG TPA: hypothetical protein VGK25_07555 [Ignavibacteria bacterium]|jgi:hypothetical protein
MKVFFPAFVLFLGLSFYSCGGNNKQTQSNITNPVDEEKQFGLTLYGDEVKVLAKGDLLANGKASAIIGIVRKQTGNTWWLQRGSFIQKENDKWQALLKMEDKLSSAKGDLISQVDAKSGYLISFDTTKRPLMINIVMANEYGKASSDDAVLKWSAVKNDFEFIAPYEDLPQ